MCRVVRVRTQEGQDKMSGKPWRRVKFFQWLDRRIKEVDPPIRDMQHLADLCGDELSHSALSNWRSGKHRPHIDKLAVLAGPLQTSKEAVWAEAGIGPGADTTVIGSEDRGIAMITASSLPEALKQKLIETHLEEIRRGQEERERRLRETIGLLTED